MSLAKRPHRTTQRAEQAKLASLLFAARKRQKLSLSRLAKTLYIPKDVLVAIESWDEPHLPDEPFLSALLARYAAEVGVRVAPRKDQPKDTSTVLNARTPVFLSRIAGWGSGGILVLAIMFYISWLGLELVRPPALSVSSPPEVVLTTNEQLMIQGKVAGDTALRVAGQPVNAAPDGTFSAPVNLRQGLNDVEITAVNSLGRQSTIQRSIYRR